MATVYLARDLKHGRHVALKVLRPELAAVLGIERFLSEIRVTAHLQHPHPAVVRFRPSGRPDLLCHAARGRRIAATAPRAREGTPDRGSAHARHQRGRRARLRAPPRRDPPRHQAGEHPVPGRPGRRGGLRHRARPLRRGWLAAHGNGAAPVACRAPGLRRAAASAGGGGPVRWTPQLFLANQFDNHSPSMSPDGRWVAYVSNESGRLEVYVRPFPGPGGRWQVSLDGGSEPLWAPSGLDRGLELVRPGARARASGSPCGALTALTRRMRRGKRVADRGRCDKGKLE